MFISSTQQYCFTLRLCFFDAATSLSSRQKINARANKKNNPLSLPAPFSSLDIGYWILLDIILVQVLDTAVVLDTVMQYTQQDLLSVSGVVEFFLESFYV